MASTFGHVGFFDQLLGPGASNAEIALTTASALALTAAVPAYCVLRRISWNTTKKALTSLIAFDLFGGAIVNATISSKKWWHRPGQTMYHHLSFAAIHGIQLGLIAWLHRPVPIRAFPKWYHKFDWKYFAINYAFLMGSTLALQFFSEDLKRPAAFAMTTASFLLNSVLDGTAPGMEWFIPTLFLKLLASHGVPN